MVTDRRRRASDERGAVLVHTALAMLALMAFNALAIDYGAFWAARSQAQNSADAAALAGAISLAYDDPNDVPRAQNVAVSAGTANLVLGTAPSILTTDVTMVPCPPGAPGLADTCIRANVFRSVARANPLPTFFAQIMGITTQDMRATATAQIYTGNAVNCMRPWAVGDKWAEHWENGKPNTGPWTPTSTFDKYMKQGQNWVPDPSITTPDVYVAPTATSPGTGFTPFDAYNQPTSDYGLELTLKVGSAQNSLSAGWFQGLDLMDASGKTGSGGASYRANISGCSGWTYSIGDTVPVEPGDMVGPTKQGVDDLVAKDPGAHWDPTSQSVQGSCAPGTCADGQWYARSPRIVPVPLFSMDAFYAGSPNGKTSVTITNIMGFFVEGMGGTGNKDVLGRLVEVPGVTKGGSSVPATSSFLREVLLVR
jgi:Flp pilus assembly protein TadG